MIEIKVKIHKDNYTVLKIKALRFIELPIEYRETTGAVWYTRTYKCLTCNNGNNNYKLLKINETYTRSEFYDKLKQVYAAGKMLEEINNKVEYKTFRI